MLHVFATLLHRPQDISEFRSSLQIQTLDTSQPRFRERGEITEHKTSCSPLPFPPFLPLLLWCSAGSHIFCIQYIHARYSYGACNAWMLFCTAESHTNVPSSGHPSLRRRDKWLGQYNGPKLQTFKLCRDHYNNITLLSSISWPQGSHFRNSVFGALTSEKWTIKRHLRHDVTTEKPWSRRSSVARALILTCTYTNTCTHTSPNLTVTRKSVKIKSLYLHRQLVGLNTFQGSLCSVYSPVPPHLAKLEAANRLGFWNHRIELQKLHREPKLMSRELPHLWNAAIG